MVGFVGWGDVFGVLVFVLFFVYGGVLCVVDW